MKLLSRFYVAAAIILYTPFLHCFSEEHYEIQILLTPKPISLANETILERMDRKIYSLLLNPQIWQGDNLLNDIKLIIKQFVNAKNRWLSESVDREDELIKSSIILFKQESPTFLKVIVTNDGALLQERFNWTDSKLLDFYDLRLEANSKWDELYSVIASKNPKMANTTTYDLWKILGY